MTSEEKKSKLQELEILLTRRTNLDAEIAALENEFGLERNIEAMKIAEQQNQARDTRVNPFTARTNPFAVNQGEN